jgi:hypothetical protein
MIPVRISDLEFLVELAAIVIGASNPPHEGVGASMRSHGLASSKVRKVARLARE